ncbi:12144_t:CDS:1, partial [Funneliformis geosporum]
AEKLNNFLVIKDNEYKDPTPYKASIDNKYTEINCLTEENKILKDNLKYNFIKLNFKLQAVIQIQYALQALILLQK